MNISEINDLLENTGLTVFELRENSPACEKYVYTEFSQEGFSIKTMVPYVYRRSGLYLETPQEVAKHLKGLRPYFTREYINNWCLREAARIIDDESVYATFLRILITSNCKEVTQNKFPQNNNPQKIIQTIKDNGFVLSVLRGKKNENGGQTRYWILPIPMTVGTYYETMSDAFKERVLGVLGAIDVYENKRGTGLLPDHKFSEIRWDENTPEPNEITMPEEKVRQKYQLTTTQRNQQKREVCRHCFKTGERGQIFGIKFFYSGSDRWDPNVPKTGKAAEVGCIGCPWYDIQKWREELQKLIDKTNII